ncbi:MAG TPA: glycosyltransferase family 1 protein, partial [Patescibacteria group bacterium]|nr:glycosyltransferase family 1 protein [Patescibacteria group bacterium]
SLPEKFILYVGDVTWNKNLPRLVQAISQLDISLVMVGKALAEKDFDRANSWNADRVKLEEAIGGNKNILKLGFVSDDDLVVLYNAATAFVFPSLYEGFGLPVLEAMQSGCPVITTKEGSLAEVAGDGAYFVDAYREESIADGIRKVFNDQDLQKKLVEKGLQQAKKFSWKKTAEQTIAVYKKVVTST